MNRAELVKNLECLYVDYYDGLYNDIQLKHMLLKLYNDSNLEITTWSELILDAQWKYASEEDYFVKRLQLLIES